MTRHFVRYKGKSVISGARYIWISPYLLASNFLHSPFRKLKTGGALYCSIYNPPSSFFVLAEGGSSFAPKRLIEFFVKDLSIVLIKDLS